MTFDEWLDAYYSGTKIDDVIAGMMRTAFEAGESCSNSHNEQHELLGVASELCYRVEADMPTLRDKFAMAALTGLLSNSGGVIQFNSMNGTGYANGDSEGVASWAYELADAMLKERVK